MKVARVTRIGMRGGSRPRGEAPLTRMVRARLTPAEEGRLFALAAAEGVSVSEMIRRLVERAFAARAARRAA